PILPSSTLFPYTTLFRSRLVPLISAIGMSIFLQNWVALGQGARDMAVPTLVTGSLRIQFGEHFQFSASYARMMIIGVTVVLMILDRKSTRLNSSHVSISY